MPKPIVPPTTVSARRAARPLVADNPTHRTYDALQKAHAHFNARLFRNELPAPMFVLQRKNKTLGYFHGQHFEDHGEGSAKHDEIALNPVHFRTRSTEDTLSTLVHEMAHQQQHHVRLKTPNSKPKDRSGYHDVEWSGMMKAVGLYPSSTDQPGGREVGAKMGHYIVADGPFYVACNELVAGGFGELLIERESPKAIKIAASKRKTGYTCACPKNAWGAPGLNWFCLDCDAAVSIEAKSDVDAGANA